MNCTIYIYYKVFPPLLCKTCVKLCFPLIYEWNQSSLKRRRNFSADWVKGWLLLRLLYLSNIYSVTTINCASAKWLLSSWLFYYVCVLGSLALLASSSCHIPCDIYCASQMHINKNRLHNVSKPFQNIALLKFTQ